MSRKAKAVIGLGVGFFAGVSTFITSRLALFSSGELYNAGDYYFEVDPIILKFLENPSLEFYNSFNVPLMTPLSIVIRVPFIFLLEQLGLVSGATNIVFNTDEFVGRYLAGAMAVVFIGIAAFLLGLFLTGENYFKKGVALKKLTIFLGVGALTSVLVGINPLITSSILWGHPEEALMTGFLAGGGLLLLKGRIGLGAVFLGLAVATKQPAVFAIPAAFFFVESDLRKKFVFGFLGAFSIATVPFVLTHPYDFFITNILIAGGQDFNISRGFELLSPLGLRDWAEIGKPLILISSVLIPFALARLNQDKKSLRLRFLKINQLQFAGALAIIFVLRFALDLGNISYYTLPAGLIFILLDYVWQNNKNGIWRKSIKNQPFTIPIFATGFSIFLAIVFYQDMFREMGPDWRGNFTLIVIGFPLLAGILALFQPVSKKIGKKQWLTTAITAIFLIGVLSVYHSISNNEKANRAYKNFKEHRDNENLLRAIPDKQTGFWIGENPDLGPGRELLFRGLDAGIIYNIYAPEGKRTIFFDYGKKDSKQSLEITTYNREVADRQPFIDQCLERTGDCLGFKPVYGLPVGDAVLLKNRQGWEAYVKTDNQQTVYLKNRDKEISPKVLEKLTPID